MALRGDRQGYDLVTGTGFAEKGITKGLALCPSSSRYTGTAQRTDTDMLTLDSQSLNYEKISLAGKGSHHVSWQPDLILEPTLEGASS